MSSFWINRLVSLHQIPLLRSGCTARSSSFSRTRNDMTALQWKLEKQRILNLPVTEKRSIYKADYIPLTAVQSWSEYARGHDLVEPQTTDDDRSAVQEAVICRDINKSLAEKVAVFKGDITKLEVDAIVNAANSRLQAGGGVDGAIHRAAGPFLQDECHTLGGCQTGEAKITGAYNLPAKYVIHTVGPQDKSASKLNSCYVKCLALLPEYGIRSIAFPCISTGIYGFPNRLAAHIALANARKFLEADARGDKAVDKLIFCTFMPVDVEIYETLMQLYFPLH